MAVLSGCFRIKFKHNHQFVACFSVWNFFWYIHHLSCQLTYILVPKPVNLIWMFRSTQFTVEMCQSYVTLFLIAQQFREVFQVNLNSQNTVILFFFSLKKKRNGAIMYWSSTKKESKNRFYQLSYRKHCSTKILTIFIRILFYFAECDLATNMA